MKINARFAPYHWCVYSHHVDIEPRPIWIGVCRLRDLMGSPDAHKNSEWRKIIAHYQMITIAIITLEETEERAQAIAATARMIHQPHCNKTISDANNNRAVTVQCDQDGLIHRSTIAAAAHYNISRFSLTKHLNGKPGYRSIKGKTFKRLEP